MRQNRADKGIKEHRPCGIRASGLREAGGKCERGGGAPPFNFNNPRRSGRDFAEIAFHPYHYGFAAMVRVERCGKSAPDGWELSVAVNSIRSNTGMGASGFAPERLARPLPGWLERAGNSAPR